MTTVPARPVTPTAASRCADAAEAAARCAAECLGLRQLHDRGRCSEACLLAARTLGACADLIGSASQESHPALVHAMARAGIIAAETCAVECALQADELRSSAAANEACLLAAAELRSVVDDLAPLVDDITLMGGLR